MPQKSTHRFCGRAKFINRDDLSRSVQQEILFATSICPVFIFQDPKHDPEGIVRERFPQAGGTMPLGPQANMVELKASVEEVLDAVEREVR